MCDDHPTTFLSLLNTLGSLTRVQDVPVLITISLFLLLILSGEARASHWPSGVSWSSTRHWSHSLVPEESEWARGKGGEGWEGEEERQGETSELHTGREREEGQEAEGQLGPVGGHEESPDEERAQREKEQKERETRPRREEQCRTEVSDAGCTSPHVMMASLCHLPPMSNMRQPCCSFYTTLLATCILVSHDR